MTPEYDEDQILELARALQPLLEHPARAILDDLATRARADACERAVLDEAQPRAYYRGFVDALPKVLEIADGYLKLGLEIAEGRRKG